MDLNFDLRLWKSQQYWEVCELRIAEAEKLIVRLEDELDEEEHE